MALLHPFKPKQVGKGRERGKIKIIVTFNSYPTCNLKFPKNSNKIKKINIYHYAFIQAKIGWEMPRKREYKKYRFVSFLPIAK